ncbi:nuclease-related domain-containing protein [Niallia sp. 01092]|uniref:nuclease-related domain-containing protein n=1 Tax=unclassified Niallia TaxID=2837522 RepID=UPI003FCFCA7C
MAQLIKLKDYISRYEQNIIVYPSRFVRLKKQKWEGVKTSFEAGERASEYVEEPSLIGAKSNEEKTSIFSKLKGIMKRNTNADEWLEKREIKENQLEELEEDELAFDYQPNNYFAPKNIEEVKRQFLNQLFQFQMKWASSTLTEKSIVKKEMYYDEVLKYYLQRFPDTYLVLYKPVFLLQQAPVELDTIIITPTEIWCITLLEAEDSAVFVGSNEKFWTKKREENEKKILSPVITINRTEKIIKSILKKYDIHLPVQKAILSRNGYIDYPMSPFDIKTIEKRNYDEWFQMMRNNRSPIKAIQLKTAESLLHHCLTTCMKRYEWDSSEE